MRGEPRLPRGRRGEETDERPVGANWARASHGSPVGKAVFELRTYRMRMSSAASGSGAGAASTDASIGDSRLELVHVAAAAYASIVVSATR